MAYESDGGLGTRPGSCRCRRSAEADVSYLSGADTPEVEERFELLTREVGVRRHGSFKVVQGCNVLTDFAKSAPEVSGL